jgi:hypothetical protein
MMLNCFVYIRIILGLDKMRRLSKISSRKLWVWRKLDVQRKRILLIFLIIIHGLNDLHEISSG